MPDPFNKAKMTGDTHPPEVESDLPLEEGSANEAGISNETPTDRGKAMETGSQARPSRGGVKQTGLLKDEDGSERAGDRSDPGQGSDGKRV